MKKRAAWLSALLFVFCLFSSVLSVYAAGYAVIDWLQKGTISVTLKTGEETVSGASLTLYRVADAYNDGFGNPAYTFTSAFSGCGLSVSELNGSTAASQLADWVKENHVTGTAVKVTDETGTAEFKDLSFGWYLVVQTGSVKGFSDCPPFLAALPYLASDGWYYKVDATPKADIIRLMDLTVKKRWNDTGENRPDSVTIQLLLDGAVMGSVKLNASNDWEYTWTDITKSDKWSVREINVPKSYTPTYKQNENVYTVTNTAEIDSVSADGDTKNHTDKLVQTGQLNWPVPVLACAGLALFVTGWFLVFSKKENDHA